MSYDYIFKLIFVGNTFSGKTAISERITADRFSPAHTGTIGVDFSSLITTINNQDRVKIHIWDTAGLEQFESIISTYYRDIAGAIIVFDITNRRSYNRVHHWYSEIKNNTNNPEIKILLVGNKTDLEEKRQVSTYEATHLAKNYNMHYCEMSAKTGEKVYEGFRMLIKNIYNDMDKENLGMGIRPHFLKRNDDTLKLLPNSHNGRNCCCTIS